MITMSSAEYEGQQVTANDQEPMSEEEEEMPRTLWQRVWGRW